MLRANHLQRVDPAGVLRLPHGRTVTLRPVLPADTGIVQAFVHNLSPRSRRYRFFQAFREVPPAILAQLMAVDQVQQVALLGEVSNGNEGVMVSEARYVVSADRRTAEFAVATADAWQGQGLARALLGLLETCAVAAGVSRLVGETLPDNARLLRFACGIGFRVQRDRNDGGILRVEKTLLAAAA
jgi:acetyltransferase